MSESYKVRDNSKAYFITTSVIKWENVFVEEKYLNILIDSIRYCQKYKSLELYAYCLMPTHLHLIARANELKLCDIMRDLKKFSSVKIIKEMECQADKQEMLSVFRKEGLRVRRNLKYKFWQDGFHPIEMFNERIFRQKLNYIHFNPVEAGIVDFPTDYEYSSARNYAEMKSVLDVVLEY
ncbi:MAG: transposase [Bacteroidales bacterium]|nr:transposase [Bacteroidales bacterium]